MNLVMKIGLSSVIWLKKLVKVMLILNLSQLKYKVIFNPRVLTSKRQKKDKENLS